MPNMRLRPATGSRWLSFGLSFSRANTGPACRNSTSRPDGGDRQQDERREGEEDIERGVALQAYLGIEVAAAEAQRLDGQRDEPLGAPAGGGPEQHEYERESGGAGGIAALGHLPAPSRVAKLLRRRLFRLLAAVLIACHGRTLAQGRHVPGGRGPR